MILISKNLIALHSLFFLPQKNETYTVPTKQKPPKQRINQNLEKKIMPQETKEKSPQGQSSQLQTQLRKYYKTFNPKSKIVRKIEFQKHSQIN